MATTSAPKVPYLPSEAEAERFRQAQQDKSATITALPAGYPNKIDSPLAWNLADIEAKRDQQVLLLSAEDVKAVEAALATFEASGKDISDLSPATFALPEDLSQRLKRVSHGLYHDTGFQIVRGLEPSKYTALQNVYIYAGLASHVASQRGFVDWGFEKVISHIVNTDDGTDSKRAPAFTNKPLSFHTDNCEIMALYYVDTAAEGGRTMVASSWNVYNELAKSQPDVIKTLTEDWVVDTFKDHAKAPPIRTPFLDLVDDHTVRFRFSRYGMTGFQGNQRDETLPAPTQDQIRALDAVQFTAAANAIALPVAKGDILFGNDTVILHAREGYTDHQEHGHTGDQTVPSAKVDGAVANGTTPQRHLIKMYLRDPSENWPVPKSAQDYWQKMYGPNRPDGARHEMWNIVHRAANITPGDGDSRSNG